MSNHRDSQQQQQQQQHAHNDTHSNAPHTNPVKSRWLNWVEEQNRKNAQRASKPDNIVVSKVAVVLCVGLLVWCYYVYVGRICTPMLRQDVGARGSRAEGIVFLIFFNILWLLMSYSYALICLTPPGFAKDVVERGPRPEPPWLGYPPNAANQIYDGSSPVNPTFVAGPQYIPPPQGQAGLPNVDSSHDAGYASNPAQIPASASDTSGHTLVQTQIPKPSIGEHTAPISQSSSAQAHPLEDNQLVADKYGQTGALGAGIANAVVAISTSSEHNNAPSTMTNDHQSFNGQPAPTAGATTNDQQYSQEHNKESDPSFKRKVYREVPARLPLHPNSRYCEKCELVKPYRAHHCRHCGTCVLGMDHHCPWIGQCCGARNHLYFVVFCFWSCIALGYVFITLLIALIAPNISPKPESIDVQTVVICAIAAVLSLFTASMFITHTTLILNGQSTIENISISDMKHRETSALNRHYSLFAFKAKLKERRLMDQEWGKLDTEAHLWYQGSKKANWVSVMGNKKWKWFLPPPGYIPDRGVNYNPNPRRGPYGEWRRREDWPTELQ